jgi:hypothetical protein
MGNVNTSLLAMGSPEEVKEVTLHYRDSFSALNSETKKYPQLIVIPILMASI